MLLPSTPSNFWEKINDFLIPPKKKHFNWFKIVGGFLLLFLAFLLLIFLPLAFQGFKIFQKATAAQDRLGQIEAAIGRNDWSGASQNLTELRFDLAEIRVRLKKIGPILFWPSIRVASQATDQLLLAADDILAGYEQVFVLFSDFNQKLAEQNLDFGFASEKERQELLKLIKQNRDQFLAISQKITAAKNELAKVKTNNLTYFLPNQLLALDTVLTQVVANTELALPILSNAADILGLNQEKVYLLVFQNNLEMRPTGGFIGSYGLLKIKNGKVVDFFTDDIYNLDKYSKNKLKAKPPLPLQKYLKQDQWYLRDANWSADWPTSAQQILWFYEQERKYAGLGPQKIDGVIAITPEFISHLLGVVGPIMAQEVLFQPENFTAQLEQFVEFDYPKYGFNRDNRKAIIGEISKIIIGRLEQLPPQEAIKVWLAFKANIDQKNILVYLTKPDLQSYFARRNWAGEVRETTGDYFMVVDSNLGSLKTDQVMEKSIAYNLSIDAAGDPIAKLALTYEHRGQKKSGIITDYQNYLRLYLPVGSWLLKATLDDGQTLKNLEILKEVTIGQESGKLVSALFFVTPVGQKRVLTLEYRLPEDLKKQYQNGDYQLLAQKQPGTIGHELKINLNFSQPINSYQSQFLPGEFSRYNLSWQTDLAVDREYRVGF